MIYDVPAITALARSCAPTIATEAMVPLVLTESAGDPLQINVNRGPRVRAASVADGAALVRRYMAAGYTVDVGLAQINSANFARLGVTVEQVFDPCTNLKLAASILQQSYSVASRRYAGLDAISATYSLYNTGSLTRGLRNGYVGRVWTAAVSLGSVQAPPTLASEPGNSTSIAGAGSAAQPGGETWIVGPVAPNVVVVFR